MERPSRNKKTVNYSEFQQDADDDDFTSVKVPPTKKPRKSVGEPEREKKAESKTITTTSQGANSQQTAPKSRLSVDEKMYERNLEAALQLSMIASAAAAEIPVNENQPPPELDAKALSPLLSNCSVDPSFLGLDKITDEVGSHSTPSRQRKAASKAAEQQKRILSAGRDSGAENEGDEDYQPTCTPDADSDSDEDFAEDGESEEEEFTITKSRSVKKGGSKKQTASRAGGSGSEGKPRKAAKAKAQPAKTPTVCRAAAPSRPASVPNISKHAVPISPAGGRLAKWNPPGQIGRSPTITSKPQGKSPVQGLRLGLSRLARVKPLHPSLAP
ncbi:RAD51-associated protein 1 isoform X2 [Brienomyrus brachyistius]|uniref:RAD51-associated protein 1 isoform X2 n=1 Tax=Brienomyrus brachyistius TaxID=42636 RepID=UPI0020B1B2B8|nr:RAD51-associated protein 1 isoform X2 [Brienomyrus brachyistius]